MRAKSQTKRYLALMLAALVAIPLSLSGLWVDSKSAQAVAVEDDFALSLNGTTQYASASPVLTGGSQTVEAWVYFDSNLGGSGYRTIFGQGQSSSSRKNWDVNTSTSEISFLHRSTNSRIDTGVTLPKDQWVHFAVSFTTSGINLFINGFERYSTTTYTNADTLGTFFVLGAAYNRAEFEWPGKIDQVKVWSSALGAAQLALSMHAWQTPTDASFSGVTLTHHWDFNTGSGTTVANKVAAAPSLSLANTPVFVDNKIESLSSGKTVVKFPRSYLTSTGGWTAPVGLSRADILVVGGGGGGGSHVGGGGGGGQVLDPTTQALTGGSTYNVVVGAGGLGGFLNGSATGSIRFAADGQASTFGSSTAFGGGRGGSWWWDTTVDDARNIGSSGGSSNSSYPSAVVSAAQGYRGGSAAADVQPHASGGGGGAGGVGANGSQVDDAIGTSGNGGVGKLTWITSSASDGKFAGGGGGGTHGNSSYVAGQALNGMGSSGGGNGAGPSQAAAHAVVASSALANTGSGGGGAGVRSSAGWSSEGGSGGSGIVAIAYAPTDDKVADFSSSTFTLENSGQGIPANTSFTFESWVKATGHDARNNIFSQRTGTSDGEFTFQTNNGRVLVYLRTGVGVQIDTGYDLPLNEWVHLAVSVNRGATTSTLTFYVNGNVRYESSAFTNVNVTAKFRIGRIYSDNGGLEYWKGQIDQVKIWNGALSIDEITASMHAHNTVSVSAGKSLRAHWDFNDSNDVGKETTGVFPLTSSGTPVLSNLVTPTTTGAGNRVYKFDRSYLTAWGGWFAPTGIGNRYSALAAAGGGAGGSRHGGGGGAGAIATGDNLALPDTIAVKVGQGGLGATATAPGSGCLPASPTSGQPTTFGDLVLAGGGRGASGCEGAGSEAGGSSGGVSSFSGIPLDISASTPAYSLSPLGNKGGVGFTGVVTNTWAGGGGGGATGAGQSSGSTSPADGGGTGGAGLVSGISGTAICYAAGGGGGVGSGVTDGTAGPAGSCASGLTTAGAGTKGDFAAAAAAANSGSGGGASGYFGSSNGASGSGGSGVVLLSYQAVPDAPTFVNATSGPFGSLAWTAPTYSGETSLTDYVVEYRLSPSGAWFPFSDGVSTTTAATVTNLDVCKTYDFRIAAKNSIGSGAYSNIASAIIGAGTFSSIAGVTPTLTSDRCVLNFAEVGAITWTPPTGTTTADVLAVGGGAGGRDDGGGGGGGGSGQYQTSVSLPNSAVTLTVGAGGTGGRYQVAAPSVGGDSVATISGTTIRAKGGSVGGEWTVWTGGASGAEGTGGPTVAYLPGGDGGRGPTASDNNKAAGSSTNVVQPAGLGQAGLTSPITGSIFSTYGGGGGGGASSYSLTGSSVEVPSASGGAGGGGAGAGVSALGGIYKCTAVPSAPRGASKGGDGLPGSGGGGGAGIAVGDPCDSVANDGDDGERTDGGAGGSGAIVVSFAIPASAPVAGTAICDGSTTTNGLSVAAGHGEVFYIDTGQGQEIDAAYLAYVVQSTTARSDLWVEVDGFTGGSVSLANPNDAAIPLGAVTAGGSDTAFFMVKATTATATAQSHVVNVYDTKPSIGDPAPIYSCNYSFTEVAETIKAAANKVTSVTSTSVAQLGATMTITVLGDSGTIGQGNDIDGRMIWLTPAARSDWPTGALRLENTSITLYSNSARTTVLSTHLDTLRVNATTSPALSGTNRQYYRAIYTFRVIGPAAAVAPIIPIAMISSGTQVKHTDVSGISGGSVDITSPEVKLTVTKNVNPSTTVNADGTTTFDYTVSLVNAGSSSLVIDEVVDTPDTALVYKSGSAKFAGVTINDPGKIGTTQLGFSGPYTLPANSTRTITYKMNGETCAVGQSYAYSNTATARTGTVVIGSGSATQSVVDIRGNCGEPQAVVEVTNEPIPPTVTTGAATSVTTSGATLAGVVDPNGEPGLDIRFSYGTSPTLSGSTTKVLADSTASSAGYGVSDALTGLTAGTKYYYRLEIMDKAGNWVLGSILNFTTQAAPANPTATTNPVSGITTSSAVLNGTVDANLVANGAKVSYEWGVAAGDGTCSAPTSVASSGFLQSEGLSGSEDALLTGASAAPMTYEVTSGLTDGGQYCSRIIAHHGAGFSTEVAGSWVPFTLTAKQSQTITFSSVVEVLPAGGTTTVLAVTGSSLGITYTSTDTSICTVNSSTGVVTAVATSGQCSITATQAGNATYYAAIPKTLSFEISPPIVVTAPSAVTSGTYRTAYTQTLAASGGDGSYASWAVSSGSLPNGLTLNAATGVISGTPTASGTFEFTVTTTSNSIVSAGKTFSITIAKVPVVVTASSPTVTYGAGVPAVTPSYSGFVSPDNSSVLASSSNIAPSCSTNYQVGDNAGTTTRTTSCADAWAANYTFTYVAGSVTINKLAITVTASDAAKQNLYSGTTPNVTDDPSFIGKYSVSPQLPAGQTLLDAIPGGVSVSRTNTASTTDNTDAASVTWPAGEVPGTYAISPSGASSSTNYTVTYVAGVFTIQTPKGVPQLSSSSKVIDFGSNPASALSITVSNTCTPATGVTTFSYFNGSIWTTISDVSSLDAGLYTIKARYVPDATSNCYGRGSEVLETTYQLTVQKKVATITAGTSQKWQGDPDPVLGWTISGLTAPVTSADVGRVTLVRTSGEDPGSYNVTPSGASHPNYSFNFIQGKLYIAKITINTTEVAGVLTNRAVSLTCQGLKPGAAINLKLTSPEQVLATGVVAGDGTCPVSATIPSDVFGNFRLETASQYPTTVAIASSRPVSLVADPPAPVEPASDPNAGNNGGGAAPTPTATPTPTPSPTPSRGNVPRRPSPGAVAPRVPAASPAPAPSVAPPGQNVAKGPTVSDPLAAPPLASPPRLPGLVVGQPASPSENVGTPSPQNLQRATVDTGSGIQDAAAAQESGRDLIEATRQSGTRTIDELASEKLTGFAPGAGLRIEILGARTGARFVLADIEVIDAVALIRAMEASITTQEADFSTITRVVRGERPLIQKAWTPEVRDGIDEFFEAVGLEAPRALIDLDLTGVQNWVSVSAEVETYQPGSTVFLVATSSPIVLATAEVDQFGRAQLAGAMPVEALGNGEHRVRVVGIRSLEGVSVDEAGEIQLSAELMAEIQRFDLGTQSTIALSGLNPEGGYHSAIRVVPLIPVAPWWTLWFILAGFVLALGSRYRRLLETRSRRIIAASGVVASALPAVIIGWVSTVTSVVWVGILLGLIGAALSWFMPERKKASRRK